MGAYQFHIYYLLDGRSTTGVYIPLYIYVYLDKLLFIIQLGIKPGGGGFTADGMGWMCMCMWLWL